MLVDLMSGRPVANMARAGEYKQLMKRLDASEISAIKSALNALIDGDEVHTAGWMPGSNWEGTPYQPIYEKAANRDYVLSAKCFGLIVYEVFMERPERWTSGRFEKNGEPIGSRTYFRVK
ncbi:hypothetical protein [Phenylobacterium sp.]|jgi:hypothetical protein|uniref:hypothetical protein n=1 Tax=Phenylobacterium sp. TaxID=1871053 RepID=UPI002F93BF98